ncbi:hypothetical protein ACTQWG_13575 [Blautia sp. HCP3S3_H10_1]
MFRLNSVVVSRLLQCIKRKDQFLNLTGIHIIRSYQLTA